MLLLILVLDIYYGMYDIEYHKKYGTDPKNAYIFATNKVEELSNIIADIKPNDNTLTTTQKGT